MYDPPEARRAGIPRSAVAILAGALTVAAGVLVFVALEVSTAPAPSVGGAVPFGQEASGAVPETVYVQVEPDEVVPPSIPPGESVSPLLTQRPLEYGTGHFTWMTASLPDFGEAERRVEQLRRQGYNSNVAPRIVDGRQFYGVTLGLFPSRASAEAARAQLPSQVRAQDDLWLLSLD